jgi:serine/threonine-protein kinase
VVALPSISTGIYGFPIDRAAPIAVNAAAEALGQPGTPLRELVFALFSDADADVYRRALAGSRG